MHEKTVRSFWNERWKKLATPTPTKTSDYFISDYGRIKSQNKINGEEMLLKGSVIRGGYRQLNIRLIENKRFSIYIHKFIAEHFIPNEYPERIFVIHLDGNKNNNYWQNLQWMSQDELSSRHINLGTYKGKNKRNGKNTKMTETKVKMLLKRIKKGTTKKKIIAKQFNISYMQLNRIERGENWGDVTLNESGIINE